MSVLLNSITQALVRLKTPYMGIDDYLYRQSVSVNHKGIRCGHVCTGAHESLALEAVLNYHIDSVKCITDSDCGYHSSAIAGFTIEVTLKPDASEHLRLSIKAKEDKDAIAEQKRIFKRNEKFQENMHQEDF